MNESKNLMDLKNNSSMLTTLYIDDKYIPETLSATLFSLTEQTVSTDLLVLISDKIEDTSAIEEIISDPKFKTPILDKETDQFSGNYEEISATKKLNAKIEKVNFTNFAQIFNYGFNYANSNSYDLFMVVEPEDMIHLKWVETAKKYSTENSEVAVFLPVIKNVVNGAFVGFLNEASWAENMSEEVGKLDFNLINKFNCALPIGAVYSLNSLKYSDTSDSGIEFEETENGSILPMKESIRVFASYEFFLRLVYENIKVMTIPRIGYEMRTVNREFYNHTSVKTPQNITQLPIEFGGVTQDEYAFWLKLAKGEYFHNEDSKVVYAVN